MDLELTDDQVELRDHLQRFLARESNWDIVRRAEPLGFDAHLWEQARGIGLPGIGLPTDGDDGLLGTAIAVEACGWHAAPVPIVEHVVATRLLSRLGKAEDDLVDGRQIGTIALRPAHDGVWHVVPAGAVAHTVVGRVDGTVLVVNAEPPMTAPPNHASSPIADRPAHRSLTVASHTTPLADRYWAAALDEWKVLTASALVGIAARSLEIGVEYAKGRQQFGRPIGSFQALQHGLADLVGQVDGARLLTAKAAWACGDGRADRQRLASMAFVFATDAARLASARALHYHGGYGVMDEYQIQLLFRRARGWALVHQDPDCECLALADHLFPVPSSGER